MIWLIKSNYKSHFFFYWKNVNSGGKIEIYSQHLSQTSTNVLTSDSIDSTSTDFIRDIESKYKDSCDVNGKVNMLFNELTLKSTKETNLFKRPFIHKEEITPKKRRENHSRRFKGDIFFY